MEQKMKLTYLSDKPLVAKPSILCDKCIIRGLFLSCSPTHSFLFTLMLSTAAALHPPSCSFSFKILPSAASAFFTASFLLKRRFVLRTQTFIHIYHHSLQCCITWGWPITGCHVTNMGLLVSTIFKMLQKDYTLFFFFFFCGAEEGRQGGRVAILTFKAKNLCVATFINPQRSNTHKWILVSRTLLHFILFFIPLHLLSDYLLLVI